MSARQPPRRPVHGTEVHSTEVHGTEVHGTEVHGTAGRQATPDEILDMVTGPFQRVVRGRRRG